MVSENLSHRIDLKTEFPNRDLNILVEGQWLFNQGDRQMPESNRKCLKIKLSKRGSIFLFMLLGIVSFGKTDLRGQTQPPLSQSADKGCQCREMFESLILKIKANYIGFHQTIIGKRALEYERFADSMRKRAAVTPPEKCVLVLQDFLRFFRDGHMFINETPKLTDEDVARLTKAAEQTGQTEKTIRQYLELNAKRLDPIEGIWYNREGQRFGIMRDSKANGRDFVAILLSEGVERWQPGQVKAEFRKLADGSYTNVFYSNRHYPLHPSVYLRGEQGGAALRKDGLILHMPPMAWGKAYPLKKEEQELIDPVDPRRPTIRLSGSSTVIVSVPSHSPEYIPVLNGLVEKFRDNILKAENLIIDIRGDEGGGTGTTNILMPFLTTASKRPSRWKDGHTMVLSSEDNIPYFEQRQSQGWIPKRLVERMRANMGKIVRFRDEDASSDANEKDKEWPSPRHVAILMDRAVVSAGEEFVIIAMRNKKVTLFGENTGGVIDYQSVSITPIPGCPSLGLNLGYPMFAASEYLPEGGINATGIAPDVRIGPKVRNPFSFIINYYKQAHKN